MSHFNVPFPGGQGGQIHPPGAQFGHPQGPYGPPPTQPQSGGYMPYMQAQPPYGQAPQPGYGGQPPIQQGPGGYTAMKLPDGTYAPVMAQVIDGKLQYVTTGSPPGGRPLQPQPSGFIPTTQGYGDMYRAAHESENKQNVKEWNRKMEKEKARTDKESAKKLREWERDQRAREEAEKQLKIAQDKDRKNERQRRMSVSSGGGFDRDRKISGGVSEIDRRFANLAVNQNLGPGYPGHTRKLSTGGDDFGHARSASAGFYPTPNTAPYRSRPPSPNFHQPSPNTGMGIPIPNSANGKSPYGAAPGSLPGNAGGQFMMPHGQMGYGGAPPTPGAYPSTSPYSKPPGPFASPRGMTAPASFFREPSRAQTYTRFDNFAIVWDLKEMLLGSPPLPALLLPCDVLHADWDRCMADVKASWSGKPPYDLSPRPGRNRIRRPGAAVCDIVDIWNINFFSPRDIELVLYRGLERYSGAFAGRRDQRLRRGMIPTLYATATHKRDRPARKGDDDSSDSLSSSGSDDDSDEDDEDEDEDDSGSDDEEPAYARPRSGYPASTGGPPQPRSRAASMSRSVGRGVDQTERWILMSRQAKRAYRSGREREKRIRRRERRKRRALRGDVTLYSLHVFYHPRS